VTSRQTALAGLVFVIAFVTGMLLISPPDATASDAAFRAFYGDAGQRGKLIAGAVLVVVAALAWLVFATGLRERVGDGAAGRILGSAAAASTALLLAAAAVIAVLPLDAAFGDRQVLPDLERVLPATGYALLVLGAMPAAALSVATVAYAGLRRATLPRALAWTGIVVAVLLLGSAAWFPMFTLVLWVIAAAITLARRPLRIPLPEA
jgi:hypothetical protein